MATPGFQLKYGNPNVRHLPEASAQSFAVGDLVYLSGGKVTVIANDATMIGVAEKAATTTADSLIPVSLISPEQTWVAQEDTTTAVAHVGNDYGLNITSGSMSVDIGETTNTAITIIDLDARDAVGASNGRVLVQFLPQVLQGYKGSGDGAL